MSTTVPLMREGDALSADTAQQPQMNHPPRLFPHHIHPLLVPPSPLQPSGLKSQAQAEVIARHAGKQHFNEKMMCAS